MVMENLEVIFVIASKCVACASFSITLFNNLNIAAFLSISVDRIESDKFKIGNKYDSYEDFIHAVIKVQPWLGISIFGFNFWDPHRKQNSNSVFDSKDFGRIFLLEFQCLASQKIGIPICNIWNSGNLFA
jgi:hypothetical protein